MRLPDTSLGRRADLRPVENGGYFAGYGGGVLAEFHSKLSDLFIPERQGCRVDVVDVVPATGVDADDKAQVNEYAISSMEELVSVLNQSSPSGSSRTFLVHRVNSWSRMNVTYDMFHAICASIRTAPEFVKLVMGLGRKLGSSDEDFMACYSRFSMPDTTSQTYDQACDICYNIRYYERHGRELEDPWSCRQSAIHQTYPFSSKQSSWLVIQSPTAFTLDVRDAQARTTTAAAHPMSPHIQYLAAGNAGWRGYLNYIADRLKSLDEEVAVCKRYGEFGVDFSSKQSINLLRRKLRHAAAILASTLETLGTLRSHEATMARTLDLRVSLHEGFQRELQNLSSELRNYLQTARKLLSLSDDITSIYGDILNLHSQELIQTNGMALTHLTQANSLETKAIGSLADCARQESRTMRIATLVAVYYLPANLVLSFFSTTLVWFETVGADGPGQGLSVLRVHREIWIAVVVTVVLGAFTVAISSWWERREVKGEEIASPKRTLLRAC
ncbi:hypothetical protein BDW59DRAFT_153601 [Aspergillus cavernicola]|uniref:CorA-like transporter domain-containing protein n=1 Tax=Aspergillus cavernicola TaxID=176166 RepID=A0ABR4HJZ2_9EURO